MSTAETSPASSRFVRLRAELVVEITAPGDLADAAVTRLAEEAAGIPGADPGPDQEVVRTDTAEALAALVDPYGLVGGVPGIEIVQAEWSSESVDHYRPGVLEWDVDDEVDGENEAEGEAGRSGADRAGEG